MKLINSISIRNCVGLAIDNDNRILISTDEKFYVYDIKGKIINS
jgi:hypothetical protein